MICWKVLFLGIQPPYIVSVWHPNLVRVVKSMRGFIRGNSSPHFIQIFEQHALWTFQKKNKNIGWWYCMTQFWVYCHNDNVLLCWPRNEGKKEINCFSHWVLLYDKHTSCNFILQYTKELKALYFLHYTGTKLGTGHKLRRHRRYSRRNILYLFQYNHEVNSILSNSIHLVNRQLKCVFVHFKPCLKKNSPLQHHWREGNATSQYNREQSG